MDDSAAVNAAGAGSSGRFLAGLVGLSLLMGLSIGFSRVVTTLYALRLEAHGGGLAAVAVAQGIGMLVLGVAAGRWVSRYGTRRVFIAGSAWGAAMFLLIPHFPRLAALLLFCASASLAMPLRFVAINTMFMSRLEEIGRERAGWFRASHVIGMSFLGAVAAATLFPAFGPRLAFAVAAFIFVLNIVVFLLAFTPADLAGNASARRASAAEGPAPTAAQVAFQEFAIQSLNAYYAFYIVVVVIRYLGLPPPVAGYAVAVQGTAFVLTLVAAGRVSLQYGRAALLAATGIVVLSVTGLVLCRDAATLVPAAALLGVGLGVLQIINLAQFARLGSHIGFAKAASINALSGPSGGVLGGALGGVLEHWISPQLGFLAFVPLFLALCFWRPGIR